MYHCKHVLFLNITITSLGQNTLNKWNLYQIFTNLHLLILLYPLQFMKNSFYLLFLAQRSSLLKEVEFSALTSRNETLFNNILVHFSLAVLKSQAYANIFILPKLLKQGRTFTIQDLWWISQLVLVAFFVSYFILNYVDGGTVINAFFFSSWLAHYAWKCICLQFRALSVFSLKVAWVSGCEYISIKGLLINIVYCIPLSISLQFPSTYWRSEKVHINISSDQNIECSVPVG